METARQGQAIVVDHGDAHPTAVALERWPERYLAVHKDVVGLGLWVDDAAQIDRAPRRCVVTAPLNQHERGGVDLAPRTACVALLLSLLEIGTPRAGVPCVTPRGIAVGAPNEVA